MKIFYWSPFTSKVATIKAVINSAYSMNKFQKHETSIINSFGEWDSYKKDLKLKKIKLIENDKKINQIFKDGYIFSRLFYLRIFLNNFFFLKKTIFDHKPDILVIHLITSLPILLFNIFNFKTKLVLRISGYPKLNFVRRFFWKFFEKKIDLITTPTIDTYKYLSKANIFNKNKIYFLRDPILLKEENYNNRGRVDEKNYILNVGRLTKQKNQKLLIKSFSKISKKYKSLKLIFLGDGELKQDLIQLSKRLKLQKKISFFGHKRNIYTYIKNSLCVVVSSLWEDPGFVMIESSAFKTPVICSDCPNGPKEFFKDKKNSFLFKNNNSESLLKTFDRFMSMNKSNIKIIVNKNYINSLKYLDENHSKIFNSIINEKK